jgi:hypothetical protein
VWGKCGDPISKRNVGSPELWSKSAGLSGPVALSSGTEVLPFSLPHVSHWWLRNLTGPPGEYFCVSLEGVVSLLQPFRGVSMETHSVPFVSRFGLPSLESQGSVAHSIPARTKQMSVQL